MMLVMRRLLAQFGQRVVLLALWLRQGGCTIVFAGAEHKNSCVLPYCCSCTTGSHATGHCSGCIHIVYMHGCI
jgi:hypothetical protein